MTFALTPPPRRSSGVTPGRRVLGCRNEPAAAGARRGAAPARPVRSRTAAGVLAALLLAGVLAAVAPPAAAQSAPAAPSSVTVSRADGTVTASWPSVANADSYHVTYSTTGGASWQLAALNHPAPNDATVSITISGADNAKTYIVAARARNTVGDSGWRNSPPAGPWQPPNQAVPPATPASVTVTRANNTVTASWPSVADAVSYHVTYRTADGTWQLAALGHTSTSITIDNADNAATYIVAARARNAEGLWSGWRNSAPAGPYALQPTPAPPPHVTLTRAYNQVTATWPSVAHASRYHVTYTTDGGGSWHLASLDHSSTSITVTGADNAATYIVGVRARNADGAWGGWRNSPAAGPLEVPLLTVDGITAATATVTIWGHSGDWHYQASRGPHTSCQGPLSGASADLSGLSAATHYTYTAYSDASCSTDLADIEFNTEPSYRFSPSLDIQTGTLGWDSVTIAPHPWTSDWYYKSNKAPHNDGQCHGPVASAGALTLTGLAPATAYTYTMYDAADCETDVAEISFTTIALPAGVTLDVSTLTNDRVTLVPVGWDQTWYHQKQQDGSAVGSCSEQVVAGAAATITTVLLPGTSYGFKAYAYAGCDSSSELASVAFTVPELTSAPGRSTASLTLLHWPRQWWYLSHGVYTPQGDLAYLGGECRGPVAAGDTATATGLFGGYTHGFQAYSSAAACQNDRDDASRRLTAGTLGPMAQVTPVTDAGLSASEVTGTTATLAIDGYTGFWFARQTAPAAGPCSAAIHASTLALSSLVEGKAHTYRAYNDAQCSDANELASAAFTTMSLTASSAVGTGATLTIGQHSGNWYYMADKAPHDTCQGPISTAAATLTGLTAGASYAYTAYRDSGCAAAGLLASADFAIPTLAATGVTGTGATLALSEHTGDWYYQANAAPHSTCQGPVSTTTAVLAGLSPSTSYTYAAYRNSGCSALVATASDFTTPVSLTVTEIALNSATLAIGGHSAQWWYKAETGPDSTCQGPVAASTSTEALTGLEAATSYVYWAYSATGCAGSDLLAAASEFNTGGLSVGNHTQSSNTTKPVGYYASQNVGKQFAFATSFTTGSADGYTLDSVLVKLAAGTTTYNLHPYIYTDNNGKPGQSQAHERKDLGGAKPTTDHVWRCSGANCTLDADTTYWLVLRHNNEFFSIADIIYNWRFTNSADQTNDPSDAGWTIGDSSYRGEQTAGTSTQTQSAITWETNTTSGSGMFKLNIALPRSLDASDISSSSATLTLAGYEGVWWHKRTSPSGSSACRRVEVGDAARAEGLSANTAYTYKAYDKAGCDDADEIADETFSTTTASAPSLAASGITATAATLTVSNHTAAWHYQASAGPDTACGGPVAANTATKALAGLTAGTAYTYRAFSDSGCSAQLAAATFTTPKLTVGNITNTTATLTLVGTPDSWHYKHTTPTGGACSSAVTNGSATVTGLAAGTGYTFAAYSDSGCSTLLTSVSFAADAVVAADIGAASATLSLAGHSGSWHAKRTAPTPGSCSGTIAAGGTHTASGLSPATAYTFTAYSDSGCSTAVGTGSFTTTPITLAVSGITASGATLRLDGHSTAWSYRRSGAGCTSVNAGTATATLSSLTPGTAYRYSAYSGSTCGTLLARAPAFTTLAVSVRNIADTSATLRLANHDSHWFYKATSGPHTACAGPVMGANTPVSGLSAAGTYTYSAYSDAACTNAGLLGTAPAFTTTELTASAVTATGATLTLAGHTGNWWFRNDVPYDPTGGTPYTQCHRSTSTTHTLSGLTAGHTYTFKAYSEQGCPPAKTVATATFTTPTS